MKRYIFLGKETIKELIRVGLIKKVDGIMKLQGAIVIENKPIK